MHFVSYLDDVLFCKFLDNIFYNDALCLEAKTDSYLESVIFC